MVQEVPAEAQGQSWAMRALPAAVLDAIISISETKERSIVRTACKSVDVRQARTSE